MFRTDSERISVVLDLLHNRKRCLFSQPGLAINKDKEEGKDGLVKKLTSSLPNTETLGVVSKFSAPPIEVCKQSQKSHR